MSGHVFTCSHTLSSVLMYVLSDNNTVKLGYVLFVTLDISEFFTYAGLLVD